MGLMLRMCKSFTNMRNTFTNTLDIVCLPVSIGEVVSRHCRFQKSLEIESVDLRLNLGTDVSNLGRHALEKFSGFEVCKRAFSLC